MLRTSKGARILLHLLLCMFLLGGASKAKADELVPQWLANEVYALARVIYGEARGLPEFAQYDVAHSVMNRAALNRKDFGGNTIAGVAFHSTKKPNGVIMYQYSSISGSIDDAWQPKDLDAWFLSLIRAWKVYTKRQVPSEVMQKGLYFLNPDDSSQGNKNWFSRKLIPIGWSSKHLFFSER